MMPQLARQISSLPIVGSPRQDGQSLQGLGSQRLQQRNGVQRQEQRDQAAHHPSDEAVNARVPAQTWLRCQD
jgi:hypothetical protein